MPDTLHILDDLQLDENLRLVQIGDVLSPLELSKTDIRATGDLEVAGDLKVAGNIIGEVTDLTFGDIVVDSIAGSGDLDIAAPSGDITLTPTGADVKLNTGAGVTMMQFAVTTPYISLFSAANQADSFSVVCTTNGATLLSTTDADDALAHLTLDADGELNLDAGLTDDDFSGILLKQSGTTFGSLSAHHGASIFLLAENAGASLVDYFKIKCEANGASTIETVDDAGDDAHLTFQVDGDTILNRDVSNTSAGTYTGFSVDFDKTGSSSSNNTLYALIIDADNASATSGINTLYGIRNTPTLTHASDSGTPTLYGLSQIVTGSTNGSSTATGITQTITGADTQIGFAQKVDDGGIDIKLKSSANTNDYFTISTTTHGETTVETVDADASVAHLNFTVDGSINFDVVGTVEFDGCGVGFDLVTPTYNASDTDVDFTTGNKQFVTFGSGNITDLNLIFPKTSGNFTLLLKQDGTGSRTVTNYKVWDRVDSSAASGSATVKFAGGSNPTLTTDANHVDIVSFFYDADNEIAYGVASLDFQF